LSSNASDDIGAAEIRKSQVDECDIRAQSVEEYKSFLACPRFGHNPHVILAADDGRPSLADKGMVSTTMTLMTSSIAIAFTTNSFADSGDGERWHEFAPHLRACS
jgi:hypothetical protein